VYKMKKNSANKIKLGIFVSLGLLVLIIAIYFIGEKQLLFSNTIRLTGVFKDVAGLQAGNNVRLSGISIGTVESISLVSDTTVRVEIVIDESSRKFIKKDAIATIGSEGLIGNKVLVINPGTGGKKSIENNDIIQTAQPIDVDDIMVSLKATIDNTASITGDLAKISTNIESGNGTIGKLVMDHTWRRNFESTIVNLKEGSDEFKVVMSKAGEIDSILIAIKSTIAYTANITSDLAAITNSLQSGKGTIGRLLMNTTAAENFDSTMVNLKEGTAALKLLLEKAQGSWLLSF
jgi:phospholipid/cholesterol/gamma-HCH transport system substrate-binding protein